jgi:hypothetical protein
MQNVRLHPADGVVLNIRHLRGEMKIRPGYEFPIFDDQGSYTLQLASAEILVDAASLAALMNRHVFAYDGAPLKDVEVEFEDGRIKQKGKMHKAVWLPFSMKADVGVTPDGRLRLHTHSMSALGIPATKLLDFFGLELDDVVSIEKRRGVEIKDDDVIIAPGSVLPPPAIEGRIASAAIAGAELRLVYAPRDGREPAALAPPDPRAPNYIYFSGSVIRFGKLTMTGADLQLIDADPHDPFDFSPPQYDRQLIAGYSKNTPQKGLKTFMPDFDDLGTVTSLTPQKTGPARGRE